MYEVLFFIMWFMSFILAFAGGMAVMGWKQAQAMNNLTQGGVNALNNFVNKIGGSNAKEAVNNFGRDIVERHSDVLNDPIKEKESGKEDATGTSG